MSPAVPALLAALLAGAWAAPRPARPRLVSPGGTGSIHVAGLVKAREDGTKVLERVLAVDVQAPSWFILVSSRVPRVSWDAARLFTFEYRLAEDAPPGPFTVILRKTVERKRPRPAGGRHVDEQELLFEVAPAPVFGSPMGRSLFRGFFLFLAALAGHVVLWRRRAPKRHVPALLGAFSVPALMYAALAPARGCDLWSDLLAYAALAAAYMQTYPAAQAQSPTLLIAAALEAAPSGLSDEELSRALPREMLVGDRVADLLAAGLVVPGSRPGTVRLAERGALLLPPFRLLRLILGLPEGRG